MLNKSLYSPGFRTVGLITMSTLGKFPNSRGYHDPVTGQTTIFDNYGFTVGHEYEHHLQSISAGPVNFLNAYHNYPGDIELNYKTNNFIILVTPIP